MVTTFGLPNATGFPKPTGFRAGPNKEIAVEEKKVELCGMLVSEKVRDEAVKTWPTRPPTGFDDRSWSAALANHVLLVARDHGEEPETAPRTRV